MSVTCSQAENMKEGKWTKNGRPALIGCLYEMHAFDGGEL